MTGITINFRGPHPGMGKREWNNLVREMFHHLGIIWHKDFRAKHFTRRGASEYGYAPRSGERGNIPPQGFHRSYTGQKLKRFGHTRPLVFTGESERATRQRDIRATATSKRAKVRVHLHAPKLNFRNPKSKTNPGEEVRTISRKEARALTRGGAKNLSASLRRYRKTTRKKL